MTSCQSEPLAATAPHLPPSPRRGGSGRRAPAWLAMAALATVLGATPPPAAPEATPAAKAATATLELAAVSVSPAAPGADTLCQLRVEVVDHGDRIASQLAFIVKVNGQELPVYRNQLFMQRLDPGKSATVRLYNFWTTETGRAAPADGKYRIEVTLAAARWYQIANENGTEVWTPLGTVDGLPVTATTTAGK